MANSFYKIASKVIDNVVNREDIDNLFDTAESIDELQMAEDFERRVDILDEFTEQRTLAPGCSRTAPVLWDQNTEW